MHRHQSIKLLSLLLALCCCAAKAENQFIPSPEAGTGLEGAISLHSITGGPVIKGVPDARPLANTTFVIRKGDQTVGDFTTDAQGQFRVSLPAGHYTVSKKNWKSRVGFFGPFPVEITAGEMQKVQLNCDTGMQ